MSKRLITRGASRIARGNCGFSLLEVMIAVAIFLVLLVAVYRLVLTSQETYTTSKVLASAETSARRGVDRIAEELQNVGTSTLAPASPIAPFGSPQLGFRKNTGYDTVTEQITWSDPFLIRFDDSGDPVVIYEELDAVGAVRTSSVLVRDVCSYAEGETSNGADDNGNGLMDERGLSFELNGDTITVRLSIRKTDDKDREYTATAETSVRLRN